MAVILSNIIKLREITKAGITDCKNALIEAEGDFDKAIEIIRKKGQDVAIKRSDRETSEGCVLAKSIGDYAAMIALKCETDFVAKNADFVTLTQTILDAAIANKCQTLDEIKALPIGSGTIADAIVERSGITGEKIELDGYFFVSGAYTTIYNHMNKNQLCTIVAFNKICDEKIAHEVCMQIAAMNPIAISEKDLSEEIKQKELNLAIEKAKIEKPNVSQNIIENIAKGRLNKFLKEVCLLNQESIMKSKKTVAEVLKDTDPELIITDFKRFTLHAE